MSDLSFKFAGFQDQTASNHAALMLAIAGLGAKLDAIALGLMSEPGALTFADVIAAIDRGTANGVLRLAQQTAIATTLSSIHLDTQSMDLKLLTMRNTLSDIHLDTQSMDLKLLSVRDSLIAILEAMPTGGNDLLITAIKTAIGTPSGDAATTVLGLLSGMRYSIAGLYSSTGILGPGGSTVLKLLGDIAECGCEGSGVADARDCSDVYSSNAMLLLPFGIMGYDAFMLARWGDDLPAGITKSTFFGTDDIDTVLYRDDWAGWRALVTSDGAQHGRKSLDTARFPNNVWLDLPAGSAFYAWSVGELESIVVSLCPPGTVLTEWNSSGGGGGLGGGEVTECTESIGTVNDHPSHFAFWDWFQVWEDGIAGAGSLHAEGGNNIFLHGDLVNYGVRAKVGNSYIYTNLSGTTSIGQATTTNIVYFPAGTTWMLACSGVTPDVTLEVCPAETNTT